MTYFLLTSLSLIFGGCCTYGFYSPFVFALKITNSNRNAITLEQLTSQYPSAGSLSTFFQFLVISLHGLPNHVAWTSYGPRFKPPRIPLTTYLIQVVLFYFISLLNNAAFAYRIPMAVHIIFRSGGLIISLLLGWVVIGKRSAFFAGFSLNNELNKNTGIHLHRSFQCSSSHSELSSLHSQPLATSTLRQLKQIHIHTQQASPSLPSHLFSLVF